MHQNRFHTAFQNLFLGVKQSEYHTGFRDFSRELLETLPLLENSDDFVFDNQMVAQAVMFGFHIGEISCPTKYFREASSINFQAERGVRAGRAVNDVRFCRPQMEASSFVAIRSDGQKNYKLLFLDSYPELLRSRRWHLLQRGVTEQACCSFSSPLESRFFGASLWNAARVTE